MSQAMKDVKAITIPQGTVKKITDSNGNMIWGSYDAFPYRRLEYLKFSGSEYIMTGWQGKQGYPKEIKFSIDSDNFYPSAYTFVTGTYDGSPANNRRRYYVRPSVDTASSTVSQYGIDVCMGNTWASSSKFFDIDQPYVARVSCYQDETNNNYRTMQIYVLDENASSQKWYTNVSSGTTSTVTSKALALMANNSTSVEYMTKGKLYYAKEYSGGSTYAQRGYANWTYLAGYYPVQRKSDGVCGLYRVDNGTFMPMVGTNITSAAAGPVVDEYWDLQEPISWTTVWSGRRTCSYGRNTGFGTVATVPYSADQMRFRITFTDMGASARESSGYPASLTFIPSDKSSPYVSGIVASNVITTLIESYGYSNYLSVGCKVSLRYNPGTGDLSVALVENPSDKDWANAWFILTKIEVGVTS